MRKAILILAIGIAGCGGSPGGSCPSDEPSSCVIPAPSYSTDIAPIIQNRCFACHSDTSDVSGFLLGNYDEIQQVGSGSILSQLVNCNMPPTSSPQPTSAERALLLHWLVCGAPNN